MKQNEDLRRCRNASEEAGESQGGRAKPDSQSGWRDS